MKLPFKKVDFVLFSLKNMSPMTKKSIPKFTGSRGTNPPETPIRFSKVLQAKDDTIILRWFMRIEQVIQQYNNQGFNQPNKPRKPFILKPKAKPGNVGCIDMICLSPEQENECHTFGWLLTCIHLITDERLNEWMKNSYCQSASPDDVIIEKLLIEVL
jgi:hypothetical protein